MVIPSDCQNHFHFFLQLHRLQYLEIADPIISVTTETFTRNPYEMKTLFTVLLASVVLSANSAPFVIPITVSGKQTGNKTVISWMITENELASQFELEKSLDGKSFSTCAIIFSTSKTGIEHYTISEKTNKQSLVAYRIRLIYKSSVVFYSNAVVFKMRENKDGKKIQLLGNPVTSSVKVSYDVEDVKPDLFNVYSATGKYLFSQKIVSYKGENVFDIPVQHLQPNNYFIVEVVLQDGKRETIKFLKR